MLDQNTALSSRGSNLVGKKGQKLGQIEDIYLDRETEKPEWALVNTGLVGVGSSFVPLAQASQKESNIRVPYDKNKVKGAPSMEPDGELSQQEEAELYRYYGLEYSEYRSDTGLSEGRAGTTDDAMTRSEEELQVGKTKREAGTARLQKYVVSEPVTETVQVQREQAKVEREPVTDADATADIGESEQEVTLAEEAPVAEKRAVPKERVRMTKEPVTEERQVSEELRKEQIEVEGDVQR
jgi:uncharacterized protein (TIGR02271 family)